MKQKAKTGAILTLVGLLVASVVVFFVNRPAHVQATDLTFETSPMEVEVIIEGEQYGMVTSGQTLTVPLADRAEIEIAREGFRTYSSTVEITPGVPHTVNAELLPESQQAEEVLEEERQLLFQNETAEQYLEEAETAYDDHPILDELPQHGEFYSAYQGLSESSGHDFAIHLYLYKGHEKQGRESFRTWLEDQLS